MLNATKIRTSFPERTIFVTTGILVDWNCYNVPKGCDIYPSIHRHNGYTPATQEMKEHYDSYRTGEPLPTASTVDIPETESPVVELLKKIINDDALKAPTAEDGFYVEPDLWYILVRNVLQKKNTLIKGPTGCGKTEIVKLIGKRRSLVFSKIDMAGMQDAISGLLGVHRLEGAMSK